MSATGLTPLDQMVIAQRIDPSLPPNALPSERALLGAVLWHGPWVARQLVPSDFYRDWHGQLLSIIRELYGRHPTISYLDPVAVKDELFRQGLHDKATDMLFMYSEANQLAVSDISARYHAERILDSAEARIVQRLGQRIATTSPDNALSALAEMQPELASVRARAGDDDQVSASQLSELARLNALAAATSTPAMSTGLTDLDRVLNGGLRPSTFNVLGARPGVGKSMMACGVALHMGSTGGCRVLYVTLELPASEVTNRMVANVSGVELTNLQNPERLSDHDYHRYGDARERIQDWPIHIVDGAKTIAQVEDAARRFLASVPSGLLIVDYLGRIREDGAAASRERHVALCSSRLTDLAHELRIPVLCVVSFSRDSVKRGGPPRMDDIRDSGNVESDADTVMLLWQPEPTQAEEIDLIVAKNRYGPETTVQLRKQGHRGRLASATTRGWAA